MMWTLIVSGSISVRSRRRCVELRFSQDVHQLHKWHRNQGANEGGPLFLKRHTGGKPKS